MYAGHQWIAILMPYFAGWHNGFQKVDQIPEQLLIVHIPVEFEQFPRCAIRSGSQPGSMKPFEPESIVLKIHRVYLSMISWS